MHGRSHRRDMRNVSGNDTESEMSAGVWASMGVGPVRGAELQGRILGCTRYLFGPGIELERVRVGSLCTCAV